MTPRRVPWKVRLQLTWFRLKALFVHWYVNPAAPPEAIGKTKVSAQHRPVPIELGFFLHADGAVYQRMRTGDGDRKIESDDVKALVHREYRILRDTTYARYKQRQKIIEKLKAFASRRKDLDSAKREAVS